MTNLELVLNMLAEASTTKISQVKKPDTFNQNRKIAKEGGRAAKKAREDIEKTIGKSIISKKGEPETSNIKIKTSPKDRSIIKIK